MSLLVVWKSPRSTSLTIMSAVRCIASLLNGDDPQRPVLFKNLNKSTKVNSFIDWLKEKWNTVLY